MISFDTLQEQTLTLRRRLVLLLNSFPAQHVDTIPPTWKNNARWHAGHLVVTPHLLTHRLMGEPLGVPEQYCSWFAKETTPDSWQENPPPSYEELVGLLIPNVEQLFAEFAGRLCVPFPKPYKTASGALLRTPAEALNFSFLHDGIHTGMLLALRRNLELGAP